MQATGWQVDRARALNVLAAVLLTLGVLWWIAAGAQAFETKARSAIVIDFETGTVLLDKNADAPLPPASMSKLMTLNMVFEALEDGRLTLDERLPVSEHAMSYGGSTMFLTTRDRVRVEDLIRGVIVLSGNDAAAVLAEALSPDGTEAGFAELMTRRARQLGMTQSHFANSNGWPDPGQRMSVRDLATLAIRLIREFPQYYHYFSETEFAFDNRAPKNRYNRNPLLKLGIGADGLKTGHTQEAGYGLVGSAVQGDRRVVFVLSGLPTKADRASESEHIARWAFRQFTKKKILAKGQVVGQAPVWMGTEDRVDLIVDHDVEALIPVIARDELSARLSLSAPLPAPIAAGAQVGTLVIDIPDLPPLTVPVVTAADVAEAGLLQRMWLSAKKLAATWLAGDD